VLEAPRQPILLSQ